MTIAIFPADSLTYAAKADRIANALELPGTTSARPLGSMSGVRVGTPTDTVSVAGSTVTIKTHVGVIDKHTGADSGPFRYAVTANETLTLTAPHATLPRIDLITLRVDAPELSDGTGAPAVVAVRTTGTAAGSPVAPAPATTRELTLATVLVPQSGGGSAVVTWSAPYVPAAGGIIPVRTNTERDALHVAYPGTTDAPLYVHRKDATAGSRLEVNDGSGWSAVGSTPVTPGTIPMIPSSVAGTGVTVSGSRIVLSGATGNINLNGLFSSTYKHYMVKMRLKVTSGGGVGLTLRASGTDSSTGYDRTRLSGVGTATPTTAQSANAVNWELVAAALATGMHTVSIDLSYPADVDNTAAILTTASTDTPMTAAAAIVTATLSHRTAAAYDGLSLALSSSTATGYITVTAVNA